MSMRTQRQEKVWMKDHTKYVWYPGEVIGEIAEQDLLIVRDDEGYEAKISKKTAKYVNLSSLGGVSDLLNLGDFTEGCILHNIRERFKTGKIYTAIGGMITVAMNPGKIIQELYNNEARKLYRGRGLAELQTSEPHVYRTAEILYQALRSEERGQTIVITGESGAGKTETTKYIMKYLANTHKKEYSPFISNTESWKETQASIEEKILSSNDVLEPFGNAKTIKNDNSSRFGKFIRIRFDIHQRIESAQIEKFLLEKTRLTSTGADERNYHIFYLLLTKASPEFQAKYRVYPKTKYNYVNHNSSNKMNSSEDSQRWESLRQGLNKLQFSPEHQDAIFRVTSAVMHLGNIEFKGEKLRGSDICKFDSNNQISESSVAAACELLQVDRESLEKMLTQSIAYDPSTKCKDWRPLSSEEQCLKLRDTTSKVLYDILFDKILHKINQELGADQILDESIDTRRQNSRFINILDIFGFEIFQDNSFEQLCINFTNERLQSQFNKLMIQKEIEELTREGLRINFAYQNNDDLVRLIGGNQKGNKATEASIFKTISDKGRIGCKPEALVDAIVCTADLVKFEGPNPDAIKAEMHEKVKPAPKHGQKFIIKHFAGEVEYNTALLIEKNKKANIEGFARVLTQSACQFIQDMFTEGSGVETPKDQSEGGDYLLQLERLVNTLEETSITYVRCIRANEKNVPEKFTSQLVHTQLTNSGVFQATEIRERGYPVRRDYSEMQQVYRQVYTFYGVRGSDKAAAEQLINALISKQKIPRQDPTKPDVFFSSRKVMMKDCIKTVLDSQLEEVLHPFASKISHFLRRAMVRIKLRNFRLYVFDIKFRRWSLAREMKRSFLKWIKADEAKQREIKLKKELADSKIRGEPNENNLEIQEKNSSESTENPGLEPTEFKSKRTPRVGGSVPSRREALLKKMQDMLRPGGLETPDMSHIERIEDHDLSDDGQVSVLISRIANLQSELASKNEELLQGQMITLKEELSALKSNYESSLQALKHKEQQLNQRIQDIEWMKAEVLNRDEEIERLKRAEEKIFEDEEFFKNFDSMAEKFEQMKAENENLKRQLRKYENVGTGLGAILGNSVDSSVVGLTMRYPESPGTGSERYEDKATTEGSGRGAEYVSVAAIKTDGRAGFDFRVEGGNIPNSRLFIEGGGPFDKVAEVQEFREPGVDKDAHNQGNGAKDSGFAGEVDGVLARREANL